MSSPAAYKALNDSDPGTYSAEALRRRQHPARGHPRREHRPGRTLLDYVEGLTNVPDAISKAIIFAENGNIEAQGIFIFTVKDGKIVLETATDDL